MAFDWIDEFMSLTETIRSPESFRLWTAISTLSMVIERKAWTVTDSITPLYPNQYIILAGNPASGKGMVISISRILLTELASIPNAGGIFIGPDNPTKASFIQQFEKSVKMQVNGTMFPPFSAMAILCREFGVFISRFEKDFIADITDIWDNPPTYSSPRKVSESSNLQGPTLNIIAAATPDALADTIPEIAWSQGFTSRFIFIHGESPKTYRDMFARPERRDFGVLQKRLKEYFLELHGEFIWEKEAQDANRYWFNDENQAPIPTYGRLSHYLGRRNEHLMKLSMISAISAGHGLTVTESDFRRAQKWLFTAEDQMPEVFRAMHQKSDQQLLDDAWHWMYTEWSNPAIDKRKPIPEKKLWQWFEDKAPGEKIANHVEMMLKTGRMRPAAPGEFIPNTFEKFRDL